MNLGIRFSEFGADFYPHGLPDISYPFKGDSIPGLYGIFIQNSGGVYVNVPLGSGINVQNFSPNGAAILIEQEFVGFEAYYTPMALGTFYNSAWSLGWNGDVNLNNCRLVNEGALEDFGGGLVKIKRTFANIPPSRNSYESFTFQFPGYATNGGTTRLPFSLTVNSRLQYDYFDIAAGQPAIIPQFLVFQAAGTYNVTDTLLDANPPSAATVPPLAGYAVQIGAAEIVAEASCLRQWMGNIYQRVTRFVVAT